MPIGVAVAVGSALLSGAPPEPTTIATGVLVGAGVSGTWVAAGSTSGVLVGDGVSAACVVAVATTGVSVGGKGMVAMADLGMGATGVGDAVGVAVAVGV